MPQSQSSSSQQVSEPAKSRSQKRSARMHTVSPRKKPRTDDETLPTTLDPAGSVRANTGDCPPYNDHSSWVEDAFNNAIYVFGGIRPDDEDSIPTTDFFRCNTKTMEWEDITVSFFA